MLAPTMMMDPTSATARPNPASNAVTSENRASQSSVLIRRSGPTSIAARSSRYSTHKSSMVWRLSAAMIGVTSTVCAIIIASGVNRSPNDPRGPERERARKNGYSHDYWRQAHQGVEHDNNSLAAVKSG